ncbi:MAG: AGE family epimerase/isomerase [Planctomycetota bacterium]
MNRLGLVVSIALAIAASGASRASEASVTPPPAVTAAELEAALWGELDAWFPACIDRAHGGFTAGFDARWKPLPDQTKALVFQARMTWVAAEVALRRPEQRDRFEAYARHGLAFLEQTMWDPEHGGLFWQLSLNGEPVPPTGQHKHAYGMSFVIYAAANVYRLTGDPAALDLARRTYEWLETHAADHCHGGYIEAMDITGAALPARRDETGRWAHDVIGTAYGFKSMNTHIHLLEAYTAFYRVWPDESLGTRLASLIEIVTERLYVEPGCLHLYVTADWRPVPDHDSFGHDVETTYLLLEASELLGHDAAEKVWPKAKALTDHALDYGFDRQRGGLYYAGSAFHEPTDTTKVWWVQAEALNAFQLLSVKHPEQPRYAKAFAQAWRFTADNLLDPQNGGWWTATDATGERTGDARKGTAWKSAYHTARALLEITDRMTRPSTAKNLNATAP